MNRKPFGASFLYWVDFTLLPWAAQTTQTEFLFQNVAYRPTVYKTGDGAIRTNLLRQLAFFLIIKKKYLQKIIIFPWLRYQGNCKKKLLWLNYFFGSILYYCWFPYFVISKFLDFFQTVNFKNFPQIAYLSILEKNLKW